MGGRGTKFKLKGSIWPFQVNVGGRDAEAEAEERLDGD